MTKTIHATDEAKELVIKAFTGNGCGNRRWNTLLAYFLQWYSKANFSEACLYHDAERKTDFKSEQHRLDSDKDFLLNLYTCCERVKIQKYRRRARRVARLFHWAVVLNSFDTYYEKED